MTSCKTIKEYCHKYCKYSNYEVSKCDSEDCPLWSFRQGHYAKDKEKFHLSPLKAIRQYCLDCCCGQKYEVLLCPDYDCPFHSLRFGRGYKEAIEESKEIENALKSAQENQLTDFSVKDLNLSTKVETTSQIVSLNTFGGLNG